MNHTGAKAVYRYDRNASDEALKAVASTGGYIGVYVVAAFLQPNDTGTLDQWAEHVEHIARLVGVDKIGIGCDSGDLYQVPPSRATFETHYPATYPWHAFTARHRTQFTEFDHYRTMLDFVAAEHLIHHVDPVQYAVRLLVPPGSLLLKGDALRPHLGPLVEDAFHYRWTHPDRRMDELHAAVTRVAADPAAQREGAEQTFARIWELAANVEREVERPTHASRSRPAPQPHTRRAPRLTEAWFC